MIIASLQWYWVQLVRVNSDSYITLQVLADSEEEAHLLAKEQLVSYDKDGVARQHWQVHDCGFITGCPYSNHEEHNGVIYWEEDEDCREHNRKFFIVLFPGMKHTKYIRNISRREDFIKYLNNLNEGRTECTL